MSFLAGSASSTAGTRSLPRPGARTRSLARSTSSRRSRASGLTRCRSPCRPGGRCSDRCHPRQTASVGAGIVGELHPSVLEGVWGAFELDLEELLEVVPREVRYQDVVSYPPVRIDLAFAVPEEVEVGDLIASAREAGGDELREMRPFDV